MKFGECDDIGELLNTQDDLLDKLKSDLDTKTDFLLNFQSLRFKPDRESNDLIRYIFHKFIISRTLKNRNRDSAIYVLINLDRLALSTGLQYQLQQIKIIQRFMQI